MPQKIIRPFFLSQQQLLIMYRLTYSIHLQIAHQICLNPLGFFHRVSKILVHLITFSNQMLVHRTASSNQILVHLTVSSNQILVHRTASSNQILIQQPIASLETTLLLQLIILAVGPKLVSLISLKKSTLSTNNSQEIYSKL